MKKLFEEPKMDVEIFSVEDVITASGIDAVTYDNNEVIIAVTQE